VITTSSVDGVHPPKLIVHLRVAEPVTRPVTPEVGLEGVVTTAVPETTDQAPVPVVGIFPSRVAVEAQTAWSPPAFAVVIPPVTLITTSSVEAVHGELLMVHLKVFAPIASPVTPEVGLEGVVIVAVPDITVQVPVPTMAVFPARVVVEPQIVWSEPAADVVGTSLLVMTTSSVEAVHGELLMVHLNVAAPIPRPVTPEIGLVGVVTVAVPDITVQAPVPTVAVFPARVAVAAQTAWSEPAAEVVGAAFLVMTTSSVEAVQGELLMVHLKVAEPTPIAVTPEVGLEGVVTVAVPDTTVQAPVPTVAIFPASVAVVAQIV
jgi:hypothetical protein